MVISTKKVISSLAMQFVITWATYGSSGSDQDVSSVQAQRFSSSIVPEPTPVPSMSPATGLLLLTALIALGTYHRGRVRS